MTRRAAVEDAKVNLSRCTIYAPIDGVVMQRAADAGKTVAASLNAPTLFIIANDLSKMQIVAAVAEADIGNIALDQTVNFRVDAYPNRQFKGKISQIRNYPKTAQNVVTYETIIAVTNEELKLKPGMTANVEIIVSQRSGVLKIANSALRARVAEEYLVKKAKAANEAGTVPAPKTLSREEQRKVMGEIFQQVGYSRESGAPPSPEMSTKIQQLAKEKGIEFDPSRFGSGRSGRSAEKTGEQTITQRTVFRQKAPEAKQVEIEAIQIKTGITDGMTTEIIEGVNEGEQLVTNIVVADEASSSKATNPMMPSFGGRSR
jgi:HlyD family secretion protein